MTHLHSACVITQQLLVVMVVMILSREAGEDQNLKMNV